MKKLAVVVCATLLFAHPSFAQTPAQGAPADQTDDAGAGDAGDGGAKAGKSGKGGAMKEAVQACRKEAKGKGLTPGSKEMRQAVHDCVIKDHPGMTKVMDCRMAGRDKGLKPGSSEMKSFVKDCMKKGT